MTAVVRAAAREADLTLALFVALISIAMLVTLLLEQDA
jgi:hypothetical protein